LNGKNIVEVHTGVEVVHRVVLWKKLRGESIPRGPHIIWFWCNPFFFHVLMCLWFCLQLYDRGAAGYLLCYYVPTSWSENCRRGLGVGIWVTMRCRLAPLIIDDFLFTRRLVGEVINIIYVLHVSCVCTSARVRKYMPDAYISGYFNLYTGRQKCHLEKTFCRLVDRIFNYWATTIFCKNVDVWNYYVILFIEYLLIIMFNYVIYLWRTYLYHFVWQIIINNGKPMWPFTVAYRYHRKYNSIKQFIPRGTRQFDKMFHLVHQSSRQISTN